MAKRQLKWEERVEDLILSGEYRTERMDPWEPIGTSMEFKESKPEPMLYSPQVEVQMGIKIYMRGHCYPDQISMIRTDFCKMLKRELYAEIRAEIHGVVDEVKYGDRQTVERRLYSILEMIDQ